MSSDRFFIGLLAGLRLLHVQTIRTDRDFHQRAFAAVATAVQTASQNGYAAIISPSTIGFPSTFTGRYADWELSLLQLCAQWTGERVALGANVPLGLSDADAKRILDSFQPKEQKLVKRMAKVYQRATIAAA
jgi:hypothetical protein